MKKLMMIQLKKTYFENKNAPVFFVCALWGKMMLLVVEVTLQVILPAIINVQSNFEKALVSNQNFAHDKMNNVSRVKSLFSRTRRMSWSKVRFCE